MFGKRTPSIAAFCGLFGGIAGSTVFHALTIAAGNVPGVKGAYLWKLLGHEVPKGCIFPSEMAQNFWLATFAFCVCFGLTLGLSIATRRANTNDQLPGLVYSLTPKIVAHNVPVWQRPAVVGTVLLAACVV